MCLPKRNVPGPPKRKALLLVRWNLMLAETLYVVIPKQDTYFSIADRSLSRLRGSPLPGAGCLGPLSHVGIDCFPGRRCLGPSSRVGAFVLPCVAAAALAAGALLSWLCRLSLGWVLGRRLALARLSCRVQLRRLCRRGAFGSAVPPGFWLGAWGVVSRRRVYPAQRRLQGPNSPHPAAASRASGSNCGRRCSITYPAQG